MNRRPLLSAAAAALVLVGGASCAGMDAPRGSNATVASVAAAADDGSFIPDDRNLSDCQSSLPRPDCGSENKGGVGQMLTFAALMLGMAFIGWRIALGVRRRERTSAEPSGRSSGLG